MADNPHFDLSALREVLPEDQNSPNPTSPPTKPNISATMSSPPQQPTASKPAPTTTTATSTGLSDEQKKANHIASEAKRRTMIREAFDELASEVPGMEGQGRSEAVLLDATVNYLREAEERKERLRAKAVKKGWSNEDFEKLYTPEGMRELRERGMVPK